MKFLVFKYPSNRYAISEGLSEGSEDFAYQTVSSAVKRLSEKFYIGSSKTETARNTLKKHYYFVTWIGKLAIMSMLENEDCVLDSIATSEPRGFIILREWEYVCKNRLARDYILSILRTQFTDLIRSWNRSILNLESAKSVCEYVLLRSIFWDGYRLGGVKDPSKVEGLIQFFLANPVIRSEMEKMLGIMESETNQRLINYREIREQYGFLGSLEVQS